MEQDLQVRIGTPTRVEISADLWGLFFEDINNCLDDGLNAELIRKAISSSASMTRPAGMGRCGRSRTS